MVAAELRARGISIIAVMTVGFVLQCPDARASEEAIDRFTR